MMLAHLTEVTEPAAASRPQSNGQRREDRVRQLLTGEPLDNEGLRYELNAWHLGAVAAGPGAEGALRNIALALDRRLLVVRAGQETLWAWFGGRRAISTPEAMHKVAPTWPEGAFLALGEAGEGLDGWRLSHHQALAALTVARRGPEAIVRYGDVSLLAAMLQDETLSRSLRDLYLSPLVGERDGGQALKQTLRAYFAAEHNASSAAAALGVSRRTVGNRLRVVEGLLDRSLGSCTAEMEAALRLDELDDVGSVESPASGRCPH